MIYLTEYSEMGSWVHLFLSSSKEVEMQHLDTISQHVIILHSKTDHQIKHHRAVKLHNCIILK